MHVNFMVVEETKNLIIWLWDYKTKIWLI